MIAPHGLGGHSRPGDRTMSKSPSTTDSALSRGSESTRHTTTRTIAILAKAACKTHRVAIQSRITSAGFDILAERVEEWSVPSDLDFLEAFLGEDDEHRDRWISRLSSGPIYVMVLERHRAAERWVSMCGPDLGDDGNDEIYDDDGMLVVPSGLRSQYGAAAIYAAPPEIAPRQIAICFPELADPEAAAALRAADEAEQRASLAAVGCDGGFLVRQDDDIVYDEDGKAFDAHNGEPLELHQEIILHRDSSFTDLSPDGGEDKTRETGDAHESAQRVFRARPLPKSIHKATTQPRLSRAAALRMGIKLPEPPKRSESRASSSRTEGPTNVGISGLPKAAIVQPKSLAAPTLAPRMNKSAAARARGNSGSEGASTATSVRERKPVDFSNTPGHKRSSLGASQLASLMAPTVAPRLNKAAAARLAAQKGGSEDGTSASRVTHTSSRPSTSQPAQPRLSRTNTTTSGSDSTERKTIDFSKTPGHKRHSIAGTSTLKSLQAPSIAPRGNRASESRGGVVAAAPMTRASPERAAASVPAQTHPSASAPTSLKPRPSNKENTPRTSSRQSGANADQKYERERKPVDFSNTPGHKRSSQGLAIASLATPAIQPRSNAAAQRRLSVGGATSGTQMQGGSTFGSVAKSRPGSVLGQSTSAAGNGGRPSSRLSVGSTPAMSVSQPHKKSTRPTAPPSSFRV